VITQQLRIINNLGLHARAASVFVKTASAFVSKINVENEYGDADGKNIMSMMMLQAACGSEVKVTTDGEDEAEAMKAITQLINDRFGESD
jgi:phosphocarrier protein HPr